MIKVPADGAPEENPPAGPFSHGLTWRVSSGVSSSSYEDTNPLTGGPTLTTSSKSNHFPEAPHLQIPSPGGRGSRREYWEDSLRKQQNLT